MMPIVEQSPGHHHGYGHQTFYHQEHISEPNSKMQLTLILPNGVPSVINVDANTPMMDLLVQAASLNKLNPSGYSLVVLDSNQHVIHFKANQTVGQIVKNCHLPQINGSSTISLLPKETTNVNPSSKTKTQPFEITVRLQVNLPDAQKILIRVDPTLPLYEIKEQICKQKKYIHSNEYTLRLPTKLDQPLSLGLSLAEYKTNELTLIHNKQFEYDDQLNTNQIQSFDRLYRIRSESQPPKETFQDLQNEQELTKFDTNRSSTLRPSHTSLHAYWNDPNFDTQSQISNCSSSIKKRRAPRPPSYISPNRSDPQIVYIQQQRPPIYTPSPPLRLDHHQSHESVQSENTKKKRKAPVVVGKKDQVDKTEQQDVTINITRPGLDPPPPPLPTNLDSPSTNNQNEDLTIDDQHILNSSQTQTPTNTKLNITTISSESANIETYSPISNHSPEQIQSESINLTPTITQQQQEEESQQKITPTNIQSVVEIPFRNSPIPKPPRQNLHKEKKSSTLDGLIRIINDHTKRSQHIQQNNEKQTNENISYFRVAKSRYGKFETDNQGFVNNSLAIFDSTNQQKSEQQITKTSHASQILINSTQQKSVPNTVQHQTKGKQAYNLLKKYEKEEQLQSSINTDYLKQTNGKEKSPTPSTQLEVTERTIHVTVTVESDGKQLITRTSPTSLPPPAPPILAPKPFGKTITEYRTVRRIGNGGETTASKRNEILPSTNMNNKRPASMTSDDRLSTNLVTSHDTLMESIRRFGGSQNLGKK